MEIQKALGIKRSIGSYAHSHASGLVSVPVESKDSKEAARILQVQIFELADAVSQLAEAVNGLNQHRRR
jgi:hypothetical protein